MELLTYDTILNNLCNWFDEEINPKKITRSNNNILYLIFKAMAKGYEVINNICYTVSHKFDPAFCSDEDLVSVAKLVGTSKKGANPTGLMISIVNTNDESVTVLGGTYTYRYNSDITFVFTLTENTVIPFGESKTVFAVSENAGSYPVTEQEDIDVTSESTIPDGVVFNCADNSALLGSEEESNTDFRRRILTDTSRISNIENLRNEIQNLPYIIDCKIVFNQTQSDVILSGITIPPLCMAIFYSGDARNEIAEIVARNAIYPTVAVSGTSVPVYFESDVFYTANPNERGKYQVNLIPFLETSYSVSISYELNDMYAEAVKIETQIRNTLLNKMNGKKHVNYVKEADIYNAIQEMNIAGIEILNVDLVVTEGGQPHRVAYVTIPDSSVPLLTGVTFNDNLGA